MHADELIQGFIAILFTVGILYIAITQGNLDPNISAAWALILGFYFGSKTSSRARQDTTEQLTRNPGQNDAEGSISATATRRRTGDDYGHTP
jgi:hypothetical protein